MSQFFGVLRHEFNMSVRRPGMWIAYLILYVFYSITILSPDPTGKEGFPVNEPLQFAGYILFYLNMFMIILGGILSADRLQRDFRLGVRELQRSTPLSLPVYILAKYLGVLAGVSAPMLVYVLLVSVYGIAQGMPVSFIGAMLAAFLLMGVPAYAFVSAFSLVCPLFMPLRVYQVLFVGYWFWGNYLSPDVFPTISDTLLVPSGKFVLGGFLGGFPSVFTNINFTYSVTQAALNLLILAGCAVAALTSLYIYLRQQARRA